MSRFVQPFTSPYNPQQVMNCFNSYVQREGFEYVTKNGESYWKKGVGLLIAPQYLKLTQTNGGYVLEAWLKFALFPGVYVGEMGINGFFAAVPKTLLKDRVDSLLKALHAYIYTPNANIPPQMNMNNGYPVNGTMPQHMPPVNTGQPQMRQPQVPPMYNGQPQMHQTQVPPMNNGQAPMYPNQRTTVGGNVPPQANMNVNPYQNNQNPNVGFGSNNPNNG